MAVKTFTQGEKLTYSDTNTYLANGGLVTIAGGTFSGASVIDITGFSASYKLYRLVFRIRRTDAVGNASPTFQIMQGASAQASGYYYGAAYANYLGVAGNLTSGNNISTAWFIPSDSFAAQSMIALDIASVSGASFSWTGTGYYTGAAYSLHYGGAVSTALAIDKMRITYAAGTHTGEWILMAQRTYT